MNSIFYSKKSRSKHNIFSPNIQTIRWNSLYYCVKYIVKNIIKNTDSINNEVQKCIDTIESKITWEILLNILKFMNNFIKFVEKDETNLSSMMNEFIYTYNHYQIMSLKYRNVLPNVNLKDFLMIAL